MTGPWKKVILGVFAVVLAGAAAWLELRNRVPWNSVLEIDVGGGIEEQQPAAGSSPEAKDIRGLSEVELRDMTGAIDASRDDRRVGALILRIGKVDASPAKLKEIAGHILAFRKSGKTSVCLLDEQDIDNLANAIGVACDKRIGKGPNAEDGIQEFFDSKFGEDNWSRIDLHKYLSQVRDGG